MTLTVDLARIDAAAPDTVAALARVAPTDPDGLAGIVEAAGATVRDDPGLAGRVLDALDALLVELDAVELRPRVDYIRAQAKVSVGDLAGALALIERARLAYLAQGDELQAGRTNLGRTHVLNEMGRHEEALEASAELLSAVEHPRDDLDDEQRLLLRGSAHMNIGVCHEYAGRFHAGLASFAAAAADLTAIGHHALLASVVHNRAWVLMALGRVGEAVGELRHAIDLFEAEHLRARVIVTEVALVKALVDLGEFAEALRTLESARDLLDEIDAPELRSDHLTTAAEAYASLNLLTEAADLYRETLTWQTDAGLEVERARARFGLGVVLARLGETDAAAVELEQAVVTFRSLGHASWLARSLTALGEVRRSAGDDATALCLFSQAAELASEGGAPVEALRARVARSLLRDDTAALEANRADAGGLGIAPLVLVTAQALGRRLLRSGAIDAARVHLDEAAVLVEQQRATLHHEALLVGFARDKDELANDLVRLELVDPAGSVATALHVADRGKSRSLADLARGACRRDRAARAPAEAELIERDLHAAHRAMFTAASEDPAVFERLRRRAAELEGQLQRQRLRGVASLHSATGPDDAVGTENVASADRVSYVCLDGAVTAFVQCADHLEVVDGMVAVGHVYELLARFAAQRERLRLGPSLTARHRERLVVSCRNVLAELYDALFAPIEQILDASPATGDGLVVSPHGPLHAVPFHALWDGDGYVVDRRSVSLTPSLEILARCSTLAPVPQSTPLVVGVVDDLAPMAAREARAVHELIGGDLLLGDAATADAFVAAAEHRSVIHLATHAWHRGDNPMFSAVRFADRWLTAAEVLERLDLTGATVVLSACETGRSSTTGGDEMLGLVRGILGAGARSLVASLWAAGDAATARLMPAFHEHTRALGPTDALRHVQRELREHTPHPNDWAPFVVLGAR